MGTPLLARIETEDHETKDTPELLRWATDLYQDKLALSCSFGAEDIVLLDLLSQINPTPRVFTLDTGRLPPETYDLMAKIEKRYRLRIQVYYPDRDKVEEMVNKRGINLFRDSIENRKLCCHIRKVEPLHRALKGFSAWITGLRREQSFGRSDLQVVEQSSNGPVKINPLANWSHEEVWNYIRSRELPYNKLHDLGYPSIGCAPCTRPIESGEHIRDGRWWWEQSNKECGLHTLNVIGSTK